MSIRNVDRHGLENLRHEPVKPLDRLHIPPYMIYLVVFSVIVYGFYLIDNQEELKFQNLARRNLLLAMRRT